MVLLRPRLRCHYCGEQCDVPKKEEKKTLRFKCKYCLAVNFLDENGDIADVPAEEVVDPNNFLNDTDSPAGSRFESSIFCQTCVKNQLYLNQTLSDYLPDLDDPEYAKYEAALPEFQMKLEDRYPQVCARCEPRVRQKLQQATYTAKSDYVRRMLAKSRERRIANRLGWRSLVVSLGGLGYWASIAGQLLWHGMGALSSDRISIGEMSSSQCFQDLAIQRSITRECVNSFGVLASNALELGIVCVWWNPKWQQKLAGLEGRLVNLDTYYQAQASLLCMRLALWAICQSSLMLWMPEIPKATHGVSLVLLLILTAWSNYAIIKVDTTPLVDWSQEIGPLVSETQFVSPPAPPQQLFSPPNTQSTPSQPQQLQIGNLGTATGQRYEAWRPPTPPVEDPDAMDWEPLNSQFTAQPRKPIIRQTRPSPFHGTLPALNARGVQYATSANKLQQREAIGIPPGFFDSGRKTDPQSQQQDGPNGFAQPTFFPQQDKDGLGLEKIFDDVFKLRDDTAGPPAPPSYGIPQPEPVPDMFRTITMATSLLQEERAIAGSWSTSKIVAVLSMPCLCACVVVWVAEDFGFFIPQQLKLYMATFAAAIATLHLTLKMTNIQLSSHQRFGTFLLSAEVIVFAALSAYRWRYPCETRGSTGQVDPLLYCAMVWQELYYFKAPTAPEAASPYHTPATAASDQITTSPSPNPSEATTIAQPSFGRVRSNSIESAMSNKSSTTTSTASGWKTPKITPRRGAPSISGPSPGLGLGSMSLDDLGSGTNIAGPRQRHRDGGYRRAR